MPTVEPDPLVRQVFAKSWMPHPRLNLTLRQWTLGLPKTEIQQLRAAAFLAADISAIFLNLLLFSHIAGKRFSCE